MKKVLLGLVILLGISTNLEAKASDYMINDAELTATFEAADVDLDLTPIVGKVYQETEGSSTAVVKDKWIAVILSVVIGSLGIHRHYLGTSSGMWAKYFFTCGGCVGVIPFIDFVVLIISDDVSKFVGNEDFFMW